MIFRTLLLFAAVWPSCAQTLTVKEEVFQNRAAWVLDNGLIRVSLLRGGGHIAEVRLISSDPVKNINPMRVPHYPTIEPYQYDPAKHDAIYGDSPHRRLSSGYMGHLLCFPFYGPASSEEEIRAGLGNHGEAPIVEWRKTKQDARPDSITFWYGADLTKTQYRVERAVTMRRNQRHVRIEEWVENLTSYDRPIHWMQHATFGAPFAEPGKTFLDTSGTRGQVSGGRPDNRSLLPDSTVDWPQGTSAGGRKVNLRAMQPLAKAGTYYVLLMDPSRQQQFFTMYHADYRVLIGYVYPSDGNPWLADWQENRSNASLPWNNQVVARGIEFGSTPFAEGMRKSIDRGSLFGVPAYRWIGAKQKLKTEYTIFLQEIPAAYSGVRNVSLRDGTPVVEGR
ncbi:MAG: hypothetical protein JJE04_04725 [Acidobacteriia bacterium]|nr:hypothetical protein [Terriglobia bacterium]